MVLTKTQAEEYQNGTLSKKNFLKVINTVDFEDYLYRYCKITNDIRTEYLGVFYRETTFIIYSFKIILTMENGKFSKLIYSKIK